MKTIKQWFSEYPDPKIRAKLLYNLEHHGFISNSTHYGERPEYSTFHTALYRGFKWGDTLEGYSYWAKLWEKLWKILSTNTQSKRKENCENDQTVV